MRTYAHVCIATDICIATKASIVCVTYDYHKPHIQNLWLLFLNLMKLLSAQQYSTVY